MEQENPAAEGTERRSTDRGHRGIGRAALACLAAAVWLLALGPSPAAGQNILDVERLSTDEARGPHLSADLGLDLSAGNTQVLQFSGNLSTGIRTARHWLRLVGGVEFLRDLERGEDLVDARYAHLRYNLTLSRRVRTLHFVQVQTSRNLLLERRFLVGSGLRYRLAGGSRGRFDVASGLMFEEERLDEEALAPAEEALTRTVRVANLASLVLALGGDAELSNVLYFQPSVQDLGDFRLLDNLSLRAPLTGALSLQLAMEWRMDSEPPAGLDEHDLGVEAGLAVEMP